MATLEFNTHFTRFVAKKYTFTRETVQWLAGVLARNRSIEDIVVPHGHIGKDAAPMFDRWSQNKRSAVLRVEMSGNAIDDKGMNALATVVQKLDHGLIMLDVSNNAGTHKVCSFFCFFFHYYLLLLLFVV